MTLRWPAWTTEEWREKLAQPPQPRVLGGPGSGNFGHAGRPGEIGGSASINGTPENPSDTIDVETAEQGGSWYTTHFSDDPKRTFTTDRHAYFHPSAEVDTHNLAGVRGALIEGVLTLKHPKVLSTEASAALTGSQIAHLKSEGYDGVVNEEGQEVIAFSPGTAFKETARKIDPFVRALGGPGSGNFGHAGGRGGPGNPGGSTSAGSHTWPVDDSTPRTILNLPRDVEATYEPWVQSLTEEEVGAFESFTSTDEYGPTGSSVMNAALRGYYDHNPKFATAKREAEAAAAILSGALDKAVPVDPPALVWRGVSGDIHTLIPDLTPGTEVSLNGFQSTSLVPQTAKAFGDTLLEIQPSYGAYISGTNLVGKFSVGEHAQGEAEFLLPHGAHYRVMGVKIVPIGDTTRRVIQLRML